MPASSMMGREDDDALPMLFTVRIVFPLILLAGSLSILLAKPASGQIRLWDSSTPTAIRSPRRVLILTILSLIALTYFLDGLALIVHSVVSKTWQGIPEHGQWWRSEWAGLEIECVTGLLASGLLAIIGLWKEHQNVAVWTTWRPKFWTIVALIGLNIEILLVFSTADLFQKTSHDSLHAPRNIPAILHVLSLFIRDLLLLLLYPALSYPIMRVVETMTTEVGAGNGRLDSTLSNASSPSPSLSNTLETSSQLKKPDEQKKSEEAEKPGFVDSCRRMIQLSLRLWPSESAKLQFLAALCVLITIVDHVVTVAVPLTLTNLVNTLSKYDTATPTSPAPSFWPPLFLYMGLYFLSGYGSLSNLFDVLWTPVDQYMERSMTNMTFTHLLSLSLSFHSQRKTGEVLKVLERGAVIDRFFSWLFFTMGPAVLDIVLTVGILRWKFDWMVSTVIAIVMAAYALSSLLVTRYYVKIRREGIDKENEAEAIHTDTLLNYETVKYFCGEGHESERYRKAIQGKQRAWFRMQMSLSFLYLIQNLITTTGYLTAGIIVALRISRGESPAGDFVAFYLYFGQLFRPLSTISYQYKDISNMATDAEKLINLLDQPSEVNDKPDATDLVITNGEIEFDNVHFSYDGGAMGLKGVSFKVPKGSSVALVGASGAGKSTILRLLFRFYDLKEGDGRILIDGQDIRDVTQQSLRQAIGIVPQEPVLFNDTVAYNIGYGKFGAPREAIEAAAKAARMHDKIVGFSEGYDTMVGERGVRLSGGEKQRVAIARTLVKDPPILVLDEATSALDTSTEKGIQAALKGLMRGRASLAVAHRLSTIASAKLILVLKDGQVVEQGTHSELLAMNGLFAQMWADQISSTDPELVPEDIIVDSSSETPGSSAHSEQGDGSNKQATLISL